jgi:hypothetical protein
MESVSLLTNDPASPRVYLTMHGRIPHDVVVRPSYLYIPSHRGAPGERVVLLTGPPEMEVTSAEAAGSSFRVEALPVTPLAEDMRTWELRLALSADLPLGRLRDELRVKTTHKERPLVTVPVAIEVLPHIQRIPARLFFGFVDAGETARRTLALRSRQGVRFAVTGVVADQEGLSAEARPIADGAWLVEVALAAAQPGVIDRSLVICTDLPVEPRIEVPIRAHVFDP